MTIAFKKGSLNCNRPSKDIKAPKIMDSVNLYRFRTVKKCNVSDLAK